MLDIERVTVVLGGATVLSGVSARVERGGWLGRHRPQRRREVHAGPCRCRPRRLTKARSASPAVSTPSPTSGAVRARSPTCRSARYCPAP